MSQVCQYIIENNNLKFNILKAEVDDTLKRIHEHKGVQGYLIINNDGICFVLFFLLLMPIYYF
jgi:hypothetical protein